LRNATSSRRGNTEPLANRAVDFEVLSISHIG
jgi:hypothetical protein